MFASRSRMPDLNLLRTVALAILTATMVTIAVLTVPAAPRLPTQALLALLGFVLVSSILMFRLPLPEILRVAMMMCMVVLLLTVTAKSYPLGLAGISNPVVSALDLAARPPSMPDQATGARIVIEGSAGSPVALERHIGGADAANLTIRAWASSRKGRSRSIRWAIERDGESQPCGRTTVFGDDDEINEALAATFKQAIDSSANSRDLACY